MEKAWSDYHSTEQSLPLITDTAKERGLIRTLLKRKTARISGRDPSLVVEEYVAWQCPQLITCAHKFEDAMQRKYQRVSNTHVDVYIYIIIYTLYIIIQYLTLLSLHTMIGAAI